MLWLSDMQLVDSLYVVEPHGRDEAVWKLLLESVIEVEKPAVAPSVSELVKLMQRWRGLTVLPTRPAAPTLEPVKGS